jgi:hypothetical protein
MSLDNSREEEKVKCRACKKGATHVATTIVGDVPYCTLHANKRLRENICVAKITKIATKA